MQAATERRLRRQVGRRGGRMFTGRRRERQERGAGIRGDERGMQNAADGTLASVRGAIVGVELHCTQAEPAEQDQQGEESKRRAHADLVREPRPLRCDGARRRRGGERRFEP